MNIPLVRYSIENFGVFTFSRSGGPGGQNVNKVNTKVLLSIDLDKLEGLTLSEKARIKVKLGERLKDETTLSLFADDERSQYRNREIAVERVLNILIHASKLEKRRIPTRPSKSSKVARLSSKKIRASTKAGRRTPPQDF